ncbi:hypothetical protein [Nonomuraea sp. NPDC049784]|uniref:hypothetical protein n=1 Tax=Nonomuraea sp. NPDC049784 TaxID=3154361 RepID=UPI0033F916FD
MPNGPLGRSAQAVHEQLAPFGLGGESFSSGLPLVASPYPLTQTLGRSRRC